MPPLIAILTAGSRGDVQPYVAIGVGLRRAGYRVRICGPESLPEMFPGLGLEYVQVPPPDAPVTEDSAASSPTGKGQFTWALETPKFDVFRTIRRLRRLRGQKRSTFNYTLESSWEACQGAGAVLAGYLAVAGQHIAEGLGVPFLCVPIYPVGRTSEFPHFFAPFGLRLGAVYNRLSHVAAEQTFWELQRTAVDGWRQRSLGLPPLGHRSPYHYASNPRNTVLYGLSAALLDKPSDWKSHMDFAGFWFLDEYPGWKPPETLTGFLNESDDAPVSIGFGSLDHFDASDLVNLATSVLKAANVRGVLTANDFPDEGCRPSDCLYAIKSIPHGWLFPKVRAVVHHGGIGTVSSGLRAGCPTVIVPECADQYFWGKRIADKGAGPPRIPRNLVTAERLTSALQIATTDARMQAAARKISQIIATEDGVEKVVGRVRSICPLMGAATV